MRILSPRKQRVSKPRRIRLELELLEGRTLLSSALSPELLSIAEPVLLSATASAFRTGSIEVHEADLFQFVAPLTTKMVIRQTAAFDSELDSVLTVFDETGMLIANNDDMAPNTRNSEVQFDVVAGMTYYAEATGFQSPASRNLADDGASFVPGPFSVGDYALTFSSFVDPRTVAVDDSGSASVTGTIGETGEVDVFRFVASVSSVVFINQERTAGSSLDSTLAVYNSELHLLAFSDDVDNERDSRVGFSVSEGETYYISAAGFDTSTGDYVLTFKSLRGLGLSGKGLAFTPVRQATLVGIFGEVGEVAVLPFVVPALAQGVSVDLLLPDQLDTGATLTVLDDSFNPVLDLSPAPLRVEFVSTPGSVYLIQVSRDAAGPDEYLLEILATIQRPTSANGLGAARPAMAAKSALAEQPQLVVLPSLATRFQISASVAVVTPVVPAGLPGVPADGGLNAAIAPLGTVPNDASLVLVATLLAEPRNIGVSSGQVAVGPTSNTELFTALHHALADSAPAADRMRQAGWLLANDGFGVLGATVSPVSLAVRSFLGEDAEALEIYGQELVHNLAHTAQELGGAVGAAIRSVLDQHFLAAIDPARRPAPAQEQIDPSLPNELTPDEQPAEPQESAALAALFIVAGLTTGHRPRRTAERRWCSLTQNKR